MTEMIYIGLHRAPSIPDKASFHREVAVITTGPLIIEKNILKFKEMGTAEVLTLGMSIDSDVASFKRRFDIHMDGET